MSAPTPHVVELRDVNLSFDEKKVLDAMLGWWKTFQETELAAFNKNLVLHSLEPLKAE